MLCRQRRHRQNSREKTVEELAGRDEMSIQERIIVEVASHPVLYDASLKYYMNKTISGQAWLAIAYTLGIDGMLTRYL